MGRPIQGLEDLHHGFPVDGVGQRHSALALEAVIGAGHHLGGDFEGLVLPPPQILSVLHRIQPDLLRSTCDMPPSANKHGLF